MQTGWYYEYDYENNDIIWYYLGSSGAMRTGWQKIGKNWFYFYTDDDYYSYGYEPGVMATDWHYVDGKYYYFKESGVMKTGWHNEDYYYYDEWYYLNPSGAMHIGWKQIGQKWYYFDSSGKMVKGNHSIRGKTNVFSNSGTWQGVWEKDSKGWWFKYPDGKYPKNQWKQLAGKWYHFNKKGYMSTYWQQISDKWYYFGSSGVMRTGWHTIGDKTYYFGSSGSMKTGWLNDYGIWYYFRSSGSMATGWQKINNKWYYFQSWGGMVTGKEYIGGKYYYFDHNGVWKEPLTDSQAKTKANENWKKYSDKTKSFIDYINGIRRSNWLWDYTTNDTLNKSAMFRSSEMAHVNYMEIHRPNGKDFGTVAKIYDIKDTLDYEIVAVTEGISEWDIYYLAYDLNEEYYSLINSWGYDKIGVGLAKGSDNRYYWTIFFVY